MLRQKKIDEKLELSKTTLKIYLYLLEHKEPISLRGIAKELNLSPSLVYYHIRKLEELGIISKRSDGYIIKKIIPVEGFISIGKKLIPKMFIYSMLFLGIILGVMTTAILTKHIDIEHILTIITATLAMAIFIYEGLSLKRKFKY